MTTAVIEGARSRLRNPTNRKNTIYVGGRIAAGVVSDTFNTPIPKKFSGRVTTSASTPKETDKKLTAEKKTLTTLLVRKILDHTIIPDWRYNPVRENNIAGEIKQDFKLSANISIVNFLVPGIVSPSWRAGVVETDKITIAKNLYLHTMFIKMVNSSSSPFSGAKIIPTEGIYSPIPAEGNVTEMGHNTNKLTGQTIVYKVVDASGSENNTLTFDIASYYKDIAYFDKMFLSYDTIETDLKVRIVLEMPFLDEWSAVFNREIYTEYNNTRHASNEFVEITL
tara:strand:- start:694 stop:1536 length:843 start_codon:yes stop_codon:yes gene_type:complete